jgi:RimJ/RimL family protein N-acetyltransferase
MSQATLQIGRIRLVPLSDEHLAHEIELDSDPEVMRYLGDGRARTREEVHDLHPRRLATANPVPGLGYWVGFAGHSATSHETRAQDGAAHEFVGLWALLAPTRADQGPVEGQAELGYRIPRRHWRKGLASAGARELIRHGFSDLGLTRIFAETMAVNAGSRATMAAVGMRHIRTFHLDWETPLPGAEMGEVEYAITRAH